MNGDGTALSIAWTSVIATSLWRACWQGAVAVTLVVVACRVFPVMPPWARCWLWRAAYLKLFVALVWATPVELRLLPAAPSISQPRRMLLAITEHGERGTSPPAP